jgi:CBS domain-containing protein
VPVSRIPLIKAVMTPFPYSIAETETMRRAEEVMAEHGIHHLPVMAGDGLVGVIAAREIELARRTGFVDCDGDPLTVADLRTHRACVVELDEPLDNVLLRMAEHATDCALVVRHDHLVGIFTLTDILHRFAENLRKDHPSRGDDAA